MRLSIFLYVDEPFMFSLLGDACLSLLPQEVYRKYNIPLAYYMSKMPSSNDKRKRKHALPAAFGGTKGRGCWE